jgi:hypothetical protein
MKRFITVIAAALLLQAVTVYAQDEGDEPSIHSVLDAARAKYHSAMRKAKEAVENSDEGRKDEAPAEAAAEAPALAEAPVPYTPVLLSFVPSLSVPFGYYDVSVAAGCIGTIAHDVSGASAAGVFNIERDVRGAQGAGVFNIAREVRGAQGAGVFNLAESVRGVQGSGVFNIADG